MVEDRTELLNMEELFIRKIVDLLANFIEKGGFPVNRFKFPKDVTEKYGFEVTIRDGIFKIFVDIDKFHLVKGDSSFGFLNRKSKKWIITTSLFFWIESELPTYYRWTKPEEVVDFAQTNFGIRVAPCNRGPRGKVEIRAIKWEYEISAKYEFEKALPKQEVLAESDEILRASAQALREPCNKNFNFILSLLEYLRDTPNALVSLTDDPTLK